MKRRAPLAALGGPVLLSVLLSPVPALAGPAAPTPTVVSGIDALKEWNLIVLGDMTSSSEVEGRTFVVGTLSGNSSNYQISSSTTSTGADWPGLTVGGDVTGGTKNLNNGSGAIVGGNVTSGFNLNGPLQAVVVGGTISNTNVNGNTVLSGQAGTSLFTQTLADEEKALTTSLPALSQSMAALGANSTMSITAGEATFDATPNSQGVAVFTINASDFANFTKVLFDLNGAGTAIVNVIGTPGTLDESFLNSNLNAVATSVIWNFENATSFNLTNAWEGSVLAVDAAATTTNYIQGSAVFKSLDAEGEIHLGTYAGNYVPAAVPEPGTWLLTILGLGAIGLMLRRRGTSVAGIAVPA
jgi:choice-of-anchor A domain-containing protein